MKQVFAVYKTDNWHSYASRDIIGIATTERKAIQICKWQATKEGCKISKDELFNLGNLKQTQGYSGEGEFQYESFYLNRLC